VTDSRSRLDRRSTERRSTDRSGDRTVDTYWSDQRPPNVVGQVVRRWQVEVTGRHHVPRSGPVILASNHMAILDGPMLIICSPRTSHALVKRELFQGPQRWLLEAVGQISVDRDEVDPRAVKRSLAVLGAGRALAIYPEGKRGRGDLATVKRGAAYLALCTGAPVVPVACLGTRSSVGTIESLPPRGQRIAVSFAEPLQFPATPWPRTRASVGEATEQLASAMRTHLQETLDRTGLALPDSERPT